MRRVRGAARARRGLSPTAIAVAILLLALGLRVGVVLATHSYALAGDAWDYHRTAASIASTGHYPTSLDGPAGGPTAFRPPLYPLFLAGVIKVAGDDHVLTAARLAQALLGVAI